MTELYPIRECLTQLLILIVVALKAPTNQPLHAASSDIIMITWNNEYSTFPALLPQMCHLDHTTLHVYIHYACTPHSCKGSQACGQWSKWQGTGARSQSSEFRHLALASTIDAFHVKVSRMTWHSPWIRTLPNMTGINLQLLKITWRGGSAKGGGEGGQGGRGEGREGEERGGEMQRGEEKRGGRGGEWRAEQWYQWYVAHAKARTFQSQKPVLLQSQYLTISFITRWGQWVRHRHRHGHQSQWQLSCMSFSNTPRADNRNDMPHAALATPVL